MRRGWSIEKHRVELEINAIQLTVRVDGTSPPALSVRSNLLGSWPIPAGERAVTLRRVRSLDVAVNELWVDDVKVPPSPEPLPWIAAKADAWCKVHPSSARNAAPAAAIECSVCHAPVCAACRAVDGVRCHECFARAVGELRRQDRANRIKGPLLAAAFIGALALAGWVSHSLVLLQCAAGATVLAGFLIIRGRLRERSEARALPPSAPR